MNKKAIVLYLHMHQPWRLRDYSVFDTAIRHDYFSEHSEMHRNNEVILRKVSKKSYKPMLTRLIRLSEKYKDFKVSLSITGTLLEQLQTWEPEVIDMIKTLVDTGSCEIVGETYYHSLAFFYSRTEFERQVAMYTDIVNKLFNVKPTAFRGTELSYNNYLADWADENGYKAIITEGCYKLLRGKTPNAIYKPVETRNIKLLTKNYQLSDDIAFRFSDKKWKEYPLTVEKYVSWVDKSIESGDVVNLFMDFETFGENIWEDTGIFEFFDNFVETWLSRDNNTFMTITESAQYFEARDRIDCPETITWADAERDLTAWIGNDMQREALRYLYELEVDVMRTDNKDLIVDWQKLTTSDHSYYMCTKYFSDGDVHAYFSPYDSPYDAFLYFMNAIRDIRYRIYKNNKKEGL